MTDHFSPRIIVGNVPNGDDPVAQAAPFQYIPDPGDGSGIVLALASALAGYDIRIRPGTYTLPIGVLLTIPAGVSVFGEPAGGPGSPSGTIIVANAGDATHVQDVFSLGTGASLTDVQIRVPPGANGGQVGNAIVNLPAAIAYVARVTINMIITDDVAPRNTTIAFGSRVGGAAPSTDIVIEECETILPQAEATTNFAYVHYVFGAIGTDSTAGNTNGPTVRHCRGLGGQVGVGSLSVAGGVVEGCEFFNLIVANSNGLLWLLQGTPLTFVNGPRWTDNLVIVNAVGDAMGVNSQGYTIENDAALLAQTPNAIVQDWIMEGCRVIFDPAIASADCRAFTVAVGQDGVGQIRRGTICDSISIGHNSGVKIQTDTTTNDNTVVGAITDITIDNVNVAEPVTRGAINGVGFTLQITNVNAQPKIRRCSIVDCNASESPAGGFGVLLSDPGIDRTIVVANQLSTTAGGTPVFDFGTNLPQIAANQV